MHELKSPARHFIAVTAAVLVLAGAYLATRLRLPSTPSLAIRKEKSHAVSEMPLVAPGAAAERTSALEAAPAHAGDGDALDAQLRTRVRERYETLYARLGWPAIQVERFSTLIIARKRAEIEAVRVAEREGRDMNGADVKRESNVAQSKLEEEIQKEFGPGILNEYRRHQWLLAATDVVHAAAQSLHVTEPLTAAQQDRLVRVIVDRYGSMAGDVSMSPHDPVPYRVKIDQDLLTQIGFIIPPPQMEPFLSFHALHEGRAPRRPPRR